MINNLVFIHVSCFPSAVACLYSRVAISLPAFRFLAQLAEARGDRAAARRLYEGVVGREACGRSGDVAGAWAHAGYGWMMLQEGEAEVSCPCGRQAGGKRLAREAY